ncbi:hypothetical protein [Paenibacillus chitinolyticus]|uniref:hypothetical protein n=1 Tax=Paenibacillus chitinolyticus TaxID=79263 RepID=UPI0035DFD134
MMSWKDPNLFSISMYPTVSICDEQVLGNLLSVFENNTKFTPTQWGNSETIRVEYNRDEIIEKAIMERRVSEINLHRDKSVKYSGSFSLLTNPRSYLDFEFNKSMPQKLWPVFFELSDQIAENVKPRWGVTHIFWPPTYPWNSERERQHMWMNLCSQPVPVKFLPSGPLGVGIRTYFGGHILDLFGRDFLKKSPGIVTELSWGGIRIDIMDKPWEAEKEILLDKWLSVMNYLHSAHVLALPSFDEDHMGVSFSPNSAWKKYLEG